MKYTSGSWQVVGSADFAVGNLFSLAIDPTTGTPYVAYQDGSNQHPCKATVMKYASGSWQMVGPEGFSAGAVGYPSLAISSSGTPFVAYQDGAANPTSGATVMGFK